MATAESSVLIVRLPIWALGLIAVGAAIGLSLAGYVLGHGRAANSEQARRARTAAGLQAARHAKSRAMASARQRGYAQGQRAGRTEGREEGAADGNRAGRAEGERRASTAAQAQAAAADARAAQANAAYAAQCASVTNPDKLCQGPGSAPGNTGPACPQGTTPNGAGGVLCIPNDYHPKIP